MTLSRLAAYAATTVRLAIARCPDGLRGFRTRRSGPLPLGINCNDWLCRRYLTARLQSFNSEPIFLSPLAFLPLGNTS